MIRSGYLEIAKKHVAHRGVVVLACVDDRMLRTARLGRGAANNGKLYELRTRADNRNETHQAA
jgi:hypothetical protein